MFIRGKKGKKNHHGWTQMDTDKRKMIKTIRVNPCSSVVNKEKKNHHGWTQMDTDKRKMIKTIRVNPCSSVVKKKREKNSPQMHTDGHG